MLSFRKILFTSVLLFPASTLAGVWDTYYNKDEMRGATQRFIQLPSNNTVELNYPYNGGTQALLSIYSEKEKLKDGAKPEQLKPVSAYLRISQGQFYCEDSEYCYMSAKFDDGEIERYKIEEIPGQPVGYIYIFDNFSSFLEKVKKHKSLTLEVFIYNSGNKQFQFNIDRFPSG